ncbi:MAG: signal peptidase I [Bacteroidales bacterium]|nr:signal peptidase I [Bacteroidales bacterium]
MNLDRIKASLKARTSGIKATRWVRFSLVAVIFILWVIWMGNPWLALALFLLFDIYITGYIPFTWWKKSKNKAVKTLMSWVDAIVYALILVYFVFAFLGQNYQIPSSSLEKTLLTGDFLFVNKTVYGPRVPMTIVHFPLVHNTLPILNCKSYLDSPSTGYHRLKGQRSVESGDIVVFNFPAGDTVFSKVSNPDYYTLVKMYGRENLALHSDELGEVIYRPVDRRENYVKRCVGLPGERISIVDGVIHINGEPQAMPESAQFNYFVQTHGQPLSEEYWEGLGVSRDDYLRAWYRPQESDYAAMESLGFTVGRTGLMNPIYLLPLTQKMVESLENDPQINLVFQMPSPMGEFLFPDSQSANWTRSNYGGSNGLWIPKKGVKLKLDSISWPIYERCIRVYENNPDAHLEGNTVYINGEPQSHYRFKMDYYFMMGDNRDNSLDSRYWGFVPEDHVVGTPWRVLISFDKDHGIFDGGIRWNRIFKDANPDKN